MIKIKDIINKFACVEFVGDDETQINDVIQLDPQNVRTDVLTWSNDKNQDKFSRCNRGTIICSFKLRQATKLDPGCNYIVVDNPRLYFSQVLSAYFLPPDPEPVISKKASIHPSVKIGKNVFVGDNTVIEEKCVIGDNCFIKHNNTICSKTIIEANVKIGSNNTIGGVGFGYQRNEQGQYELLPHLGNVLIRENVEIGNNTCVDRAVLGSTVIGKNVKIDNLVHIAHGVVIGNNSLIIANSMIGGSTIIGDNVWVAPSASIINKIKIENDSLIGLGAVVVKNVAEKEIVVGNPAKPIKK